MEIEELNQKMTKALGVWAKRHKVRIVDFEDTMGWSNNHASRVLHGVVYFTQAAYGTFIACYGLSAFLEVGSIAGIDFEEGLWHE